MKSTELKKVNSMLFISIFGVLTFILAVVGLTYAFFAIRVVGNEEASSIVVNMANLGTVTFFDGAEIDEANIYPVEVEDRFTKTFTVSSNVNTVDIYYMINFIITKNTFLNQYTKEFSYTLDGVADGEGSVTTGVDAQVPAPGTYQIGEGTLASGGETHTYTFTIGLNEVGSNQNYNQGKEFEGKLQVSTKKYTTGGSEWSE